MCGGQAFKCVSSMMRTARMRCQTSALPTGHELADCWPSQTSHRMTVSTQSALHPARDAHLTLLYVCLPSPAFVTTSQRHIRRDANGQGSQPARRLPQQYACHGNASHVQPRRAQSLLCHDWQEPDAAQCTQQQDALLYLQAAQDEEQPRQVRQWLRRLLPFRARVVLPSVWLQVTRHLWWQTHGHGPHLEPLPRLYKATGAQVAASVPVWHLLRQATLTWPHLLVAGLFVRRVGWW